MKTLLSQRATWARNPDMEVVTNWVAAEDVDTYADQIEEFATALVDLHEIHDGNVERWTELLVDFLYTSNPELAEVHAQWNKELTDREIKFEFTQGVRNTLVEAAGLI